MLIIVIDVDLWLFSRLLLYLRVLEAKLLTAVVATHVGPHAIQTVIEAEGILAGAVVCINHVVE